jgi:D-threo-aldose 1-dehydrogenase
MAGGIGGTGLKLPKLGFGTSGLGGMPDTYGYEVDEERALATIRAVLALPDALIDSSRNYGFGRSEERIGRAVRELGGWPEGRLLSTKLDRDMATGRFDGPRARASFEESLAALGIERVDILHLHDPEHAADLGEITGKGGALETLFRIREEGLATAVGLAAGRIDVMMPMLADWDFDVLITHNRNTLVNRNAAPMLELAAARGIAVMNAAPYAGGALAKGAAHGRYVYQEATEAMLGPIRRVEAICARHGVPPGAAALQYSLRDRRVATTICGVSRPERVRETLDWAAWPIGEEVWAELTALPYAIEDPEATRNYKPG